MPEATAPASLNARQRAFVRIRSANHTTDADAAIRAGYAARSAHVTASRLLRNAKVRAALDALDAKASARAAVTAADVMDRLWQEATGDGVQTTPASRVAALRVLADRLVPQATQRVEVGVGSPAKRPLEELSDAELHALIAQQEAASV